MAKKGEMSDAEFRQKLNAAMKRIGVPCPTMREVIRGGMIYGSTIAPDDFDVRSLEGWLEAKRYRDEVRASSGRIVTLDELFF